MTPPSAFELARSSMVETQLVRRGIADVEVLRAMGEVPREHFVDPQHRDSAYDDHPLPIGHGQTISQPYMVALMCELAGPRPAGRALEIGAGCGYQSAVLARLYQQVFAVELVSELAQSADRKLQLLEVENVELRCGDGSAGWADEAPYDAIVVAAGARRVPPALLEQLDDGGRLVIPVGPRGLQVLQIHQRRGEAVSIEESTACRFVELRGDHGWS